MIYAYIRVSLDKQTVKNQRHEITEWAQARSVTIEKWVEETASGAKNYKTREFVKLLDKLIANDTLIVSELSRISRKMFEIMEVLKLLMERSVKVLTVKEGYELGDNITAKVLAFAFGLSVEIERNLISQRTKAGLAQKRLAGAILGNPVGKTGIEAKKLNKHKREIKLLLATGLSKLKIAKQFGVSRYAVIKFLADNPELPNQTKTPRPDLIVGIEKLIKQGKTLKQMQKELNANNVEEIRVTILTAKLYDKWAAENHRRRKKYRDNS